MNPSLDSQGGTGKETKRKQKDRDLPTGQTWDQSQVLPAR